jgi:hypothetical protein
MMKNSIPLAACCCVLAMAAGCAAPGAPQPPSLRLPMVVDNLSAVRKGSRVILSWSPPAETTDHQAMRWPAVTRVCRVLNQFPTNVCGEVVAEIKTSELVSVVPAARKPLVSYEDVLPPSLIATQNQATYAVEVTNLRGHSAGLSNQVRVPLVPTPPAPTDFRIKLDAQGPLLEWNAALIPAPPPGVSYRLRVYRRAKDKKDFLLTTEQPYRAGEDEARDPGFEWQQQYDYKIAAVSTDATTGHAATEVEGDDSKIVHIDVRDTFPPAVPSGLQAVFSSVGQKPFVDLTWAPNTESDLAGYKVYRRTAASTTVVVSSDLLKAPAWRDNNVQLGQKYYYTVSAVDLRGNESAQSAPTEESVPLEVR